MTMQGLLWDAKADRLSLDEFPVPTASAGEVVIKVAYAGVCGTDLHITNKEYPAGDRLILGHEFSGVITEVGEGVTQFKVGDRVCVDPCFICGSCRHCQRGRINYCHRGHLQHLRNSVGTRRNGGFANFCAVPVGHVHRLHDDVTLLHGALVEPISCIQRGWDNLGTPPSDSRVLVLGAGYIGVMWSCLLHFKGYRDVTISEPAEGRRELAVGMGLGYQAVHPDEIKTRFAGGSDVEEIGYDVIIDCSGFPPAIEQAFSWLRCGATFLQFGCCPINSEITINPFQIYAKELKIVGCLTNPFTMPTTINGLVRGMSGSYLSDFSRLGIKMFRLQEYQEAIAQLRKGDISKAMFDLQG
ncbi:D-altritol 5-dehydrogenase-like [Branchiostoma floridae x Branchiostoma belcheri]